MAFDGRRYRIKKDRRRTEPNVMLPFFVPLREASRPRVDRLKALGRRLFEWAALLKVKTPAFQR